VSNDTGPLHLAQALGTRTVGIYWFMNLLVSGPLVGALHHEVFSARVHCPVCGLENLHARCPHDVSFVDDIGVDEVAALALQALPA
jgi:ADP-heptose:LPS heptosyltransferase